ncbi:MULTISPECIES: fasciclin domain-containing protein [Sphingobacterium]|uniref:fasciclin domain-containing protein n=1 Tax=Sphingobacterium TaxID=28453 RepID=UPI00257FA155|nr:MULTISPECIES: fasciclin domain-containing protein [Sphingobacterium]
MKSSLNQYITLAIFAVVLLFSGCKKTEFMPDAVGEEILVPTYPSLLEGLPENTSLFKAMWQKADMDKVLATEQAQAKLTFLVSNNSAMETAGYTAVKIQQLTKDSLQTVLRYHVLNGAISSDQLAMIGRDLTYFTLLKHPKFLDGEPRDGTLVRTVPYFYRQQLSMDGGNFIIDGKKLKIGQELAVAQGHVFIIEQVLKAPQQQMYDFLVKDGRFSLYLKSMELSNTEYANDFTMNMYPGFGLPVRFMLDWNYYFEGTFHYSSERPRHVIHCTLFAPTDAAFNRMGIYTEADLRALNGRIETPWYYETNQLTPVDSLLKYQYIGGARLETGYNEDYSMVTVDVQMDRFLNNATIFSQMLDNNRLTEFKNIYHRFYHEGNRIQVGHVKSKEQPSDIIEENINTIQGPVHVVDRIIVPDDFSMWHKTK